VAVVIEPSRVGAVVDFLSFDGLGGGIENIASDELEQGDW
jgi:hypothetical protein